MIIDRKVLITTDEEALASLEGCVTKATVPALHGLYKCLRQGRGMSVFDAWAECMRTLIEKEKERP